MRVRGFLHKGLRRLFEDNQPKGVPAASVDKLRKQLAFMQDMVDGTNCVTWGCGRRTI